MLAGRGALGEGGGGCDVWQRDELPLGQAEVVGCVKCLIPSHCVSSLSGG